MNIQTFSDKGTITEPEDGLFEQEPFFAVFDGTSPYEPAGRMRFGERSKGQVVRELIVEGFSRAKPEESLNDVILRINSKVGKFQQEQMKVSLEKADLLAGCTFAAVKVQGNVVECITTSDSFLLWVLSGKKPEATINQAFLCDTAEMAVVADLMRKHQGDRAKMWKEFAPKLADFRLRYVNTRVKEGYGLLNGQPELAECWTHFFLPRDEIRALLLFTEGLVYFPYTKDPVTFAQKTWQLYEKGGFPAVLAKTREAEKATREESYVDHDEATAIAIEFRQ